MGTREANGDRRPCILVVDDDEHIVDFVAKMLEAQGYTVIPAVGPARALELFEREAECIDLLLSDIIMPGMQGPELARRLRQAKPALTVVFMTGYTAALAGDDLVVEKPFGWADLEEAVAAALGFMSGPRPAAAHPLRERSG